MIIKVKPLSINTAFQGRRFKTQAYKDYEKEVLWLFKKVKGKTVHGWVEIRYNFYIKNYKKSDIDNFVKPLNDILVKAGLIDDDRFIKKMTLEKFLAKDDYIEVKIYAADTKETTE